MSDRPETPRVSDEHLRRMIERLDRGGWHDAALDLRDARARIAELERERDGLKSTIASRWSCGHARFPIALESHPECSECYKAERDRLSGQVAALRDVLERFKWAAAPEQHRGTSAYPYEEIVAVLSDTEQAAREHDERVRDAVMREVSDHTGEPETCPECGAQYWTPGNLDIALHADKAWRKAFVEAKQREAWDAARSQTYGATFKPESRYATFEDWKRARRD